MSEGKPLHVEVAEALGWTAWFEKRGEYELAVTVAPGGPEPWTGTRREYQQPERYRKVSCAEAFERGFFGVGGFPRYDTDWSATGRQWLLRLACRVFGHRDRVLDPGRWVCQRCGTVTASIAWITREMARAYTEKHLRDAVERNGAPKRWGDA